MRLAIAAFAASTFYRTGCRRQDFALGQPGRHLDDGPARAERGAE